LNSEEELQTQVKKTLLLTHISGLVLYPFSSFCSEESLLDRICESGALSTTKPGNSALSPGYSCRVGIRDREGLGWRSCRCDGYHGGGQGPAGNWQVAFAGQLDAAVAVRQGKRQVPCHLLEEKRWSDSKSLLVSPQVLLVYGLLFPYLVEDIFPDCHHEVVLEPCRRFVVLQYFSHPSRSALRLSFFFSQDSPMELASGQKLEACPEYSTPNTALFCFTKELV
jgi:hypothetical protein